MEKKYCQVCGKKLDIRAEMCPNCGVKQKIGYGEKSRIIAGVLALLLGGIGIHKFYVGDTLKGILYLVFFWTLIPAVLAFIDAIILFTMSEDKFQKYIERFQK